MKVFEQFDVARASVAKQKIFSSANRRGHQYKWKGAKSYGLVER